MARQDVLSITGELNALHMAYPIFAPCVDFEPGTFALGVVTPRFSQTSLDLSKSCLIWQQWSNFMISSKIDDLGCFEHLLKQRNTPR